jgi:hypothetical protein
MVINPRGIKQNKGGGDRSCRRELTIKGTPERSTFRKDTTKEGSQLKYHQYGLVYSQIYQAQLC